MKILKIIDWMMCWNLRSNNNFSISYLNKLLRFKMLQNAIDHSNILRTLHLCLYITQLLMSYCVMRKTENLVHKMSQKDQCLCFWKHKLSTTNFFLNFQFPMKWKLTPQISTASSLYFVLVRKLNFFPALICHFKDSPFHLFCTIWMVHNSEINWNL